MGEYYLKGAARSLDYSSYGGNIGMVERWKLLFRV